MADWSTDPAHALTLDADDELAHFRDEFEFPPPPHGAAASIYFVGNSLGPMPRTARQYVNDELDRWSQLGVAGHFTGEASWADYHRLLTEPMARIVGGHADEVVVMNALTVNLHLLLASFYRPTETRHKILIEQHAFPSDHFAVESQIRWHGLDPNESLVLIAPRAGEESLRLEDLQAVIEQVGDELALVLLPGVQYYTGQIMPMQRVVTAAHAVGATVGFDLAHAVGNVELHLHDWGADFATWCSYKYLNASPGGASGIFVHERHLTDQDLPKLLGWWGTKRETRFEMANEFDPPPTVESWQVSNGAILSMAALRASLEMFDKAGGVVTLRKKSRKQTAYLLYLIDEILPGRVESITPRDPEMRGCQLSLRVIAEGLDGKAVYDQIEADGVMCDWRFPDVIRVAPAPLFNTYAEIRKLVDLLDKATS